MYELNYFLISALLTGIGGIAALGGHKRPHPAAFCGIAGIAAGIYWYLTMFLCNGGFSAAGLAELFALPVVVLGLAGAIHSTGYLKGHGEERSGFYWCFYNLTLAAMLAVLGTESKIGFLLAWELMGLASFALVGFDHRNPQTEHASWYYLIACHAGAAFLIMLFLYPGNGVAAFVFALLGFGLKLGLPLLHIWLPEAHPAAPAPVSALMSGAMIELGFYGLLRFGTPALPNPAPGGRILLTLGIAGAFFGILFALGQNNLKRLLAYSSVENIGIMAVGLGFGFSGMAVQDGAMMLCGFSGAFLHLLNHALLKGGLFLGAGSIQKACGTLALDRMGGLMKRMPKSGTLFILNSFGICGLPPFNGFASEFLIYMAALFGVDSADRGLAAASTAALILLAITGGLAAAAFAKIVGGALLGEPRSDRAAQATEVPKRMILPVAGLFLLSLLLLLFAPLLLRSWSGTLAELTGFDYAELMRFLPETEMMLAKVSLFSVLLILLSGGILFWRARLSSPGIRKNSAGTWDCGYAAPSARMEYTATAFTQPLTDFFQPVLHPVRREEKIDSLFPEKASFEIEIRDGADRWLWRPLFSAAAKLAEKIHFLQSGYLHLYILITVLTLIVLLAIGFLLPEGGIK